MPLGIVVIDGAPLPQGLQKNAGYRPHPLATLAI